MVYLFLGSTAVVIIGSFLPWMNVGFDSVSGLKDGGLYTLILAIINIVVYFRARNKYSVPFITTIIGFLLLLIVIGTSMRLTEVGLGAPGIGLIMTLMGSTGVILYGIKKWRD